MRPLPLQGITALTIIATSYPFCIRKPYSGGECLGAFYPIVGRSGGEFCIDSIWVDARFDGPPTGMGVTRPYMVG